VSYRIFLAHPKDYTELATLRESLDTVLRRYGAPVDNVVISGTDDYDKNFARYGGWESWTTSVAQGFEYHDSQLAPRFHAFVVTPDRAIGKATSDIVKGALAVAKPVFYFNGVGLYGVKGVVRVGGNYKNGWELY
jgi:hypothetical protein